MLSLAAVASTVMAATPEVPLLVRGLSNSVTYDPDMNYKELYLPIHFKAPFAPRGVIAGPDHPNSMQLTLDFGSRRDNIFYVASNIQGPYKFLDEFDDLLPGFYYQVGYYDFQHNGIPELVVALGNGSDKLQVTVLRFSPPKRRRDEDSEDNWKVVGSLTGKSYAQVIAGAIVMPSNKPGASVVYSWTNGRFTK